MEREGLLTYSHEPAIGPCHEPDICERTHTLYLYNIIIPLRLHPPTDTSHHVFYIKCCMHFYHINKQLKLMLVEIMDRKR
jgi:hypothetical protein